MSGLSVMSAATNDDTEQLDNHITTAQHARTRQSSHAAAAGAVADAHIPVSRDTGVPLAHVADNSHIAELSPRAQTEPQGRTERQAETRRSLRKSRQARAGDYYRTGSAGMAADSGVPGLCGLAPSPLQQASRAVYCYRGGGVPGGHGGELVESTNPSPLRPSCASSMR